MRFENIDINELLPDAKNPRKDLKPEDPEFNKINTSIEKFGFLEPIVFNTRTKKILGGHQRIKTLKHRGVSELHVIKLGAYSWGFTDNELKELTPSEENAANIALNKVQGDWDMDQLLINLRELKDDDFDIELTGFDEAGLDEMLKELHKGDEVQDAEPQVNRAEELQKEWHTELGQMWQCGEHRVICGDCTDNVIVERVMQGEKADMVFTDPPYNVASENDIYAADCSKAMADLKKAEWDHDFQLLPALKAIPLALDITVYVCTSHHLAPLIWEWMAGWADHSSWCVWSKPNPMPSLAKRHWTWSGELIAYATRGKHTFNFPKEGHAPSVWTIPKKSDGSHPTQKPIEVPMNGISHSSKNRDVVFDGFLGSGTTMIACENLGRKCRGCEIDPGYVAVILQRYKDTFPDKEIKLL